MLYQILFAITFWFQIVVVSVLFPRKLMRAAHGLTPAGSNTQVPHMRSPFQTYGTLNKAIAVLGLVVLALSFNFQSRGIMTGHLLCIGLYFLVQISSIAVAFAQGDLPIQRNNRSEDHLSTELPWESVRLFYILPPVLVSIAILLFLSFVIITFFQSNRLESNQLAKIGALTTTNLLFAATILWSYVRLKTSAAEQFTERYRELKRMGPIIIFGSILVTTYFFTKEIMFSLDLHELRPTMMSVFLQVIAAVVFFTLDRKSVV